MNIFVGNLPFDITEEDLLQEFMPFGEVISVTIINNRKKYGSYMLGYGYVEMASKSEAQIAVRNLTGKYIKGKVIDVIEALPLSSKGKLQGRKVK